MSDFSLDRHVGMLETCRRACAQQSLQAAELACSPLSLRDSNHHTQFVISDWLICEMKSVCVMERECDG